MIEGKGFRDEFEKFKKNNIEIIGCSADPINKQKKFCEKQNFLFTMLCDESHEMFLMSELNDIQNICINAMLESEKELNKEIVTSFIHDVFEKKRNILFLIDAYDEVPSREGRINLINFFVRLQLKGF